jgi:hypothetical protein
MPTRKQKRRDMKAKRHEYEVVYLDAEGNELDEVPEDLAQPKRDRAERTSVSGKKPQQRGGRAGREPQPPSWRRSFRRAALLGVIVFLFFSLSGPKGNGRYVNALAFSVLYTALFVPFTFALDRFVYRRWQARQPGAAPAVKKR